MPEPCECFDAGVAEAVDTLLFLGRSAEEIASALAKPKRQFAKLVKGHVFLKHVQRCSHENYQMLITTYMGDMRALLDDTMKPRPQLDRKTGLPIIIDGKPLLMEPDFRRIQLCYKGTEWAIMQIGKMEGFLTPSRGLTGRANNLIEALNEFAKAHPDDAKRVRDASQRDKPILIPGPKPETAVKPVPAASAEPQNEPRSDSN